MDRLGCESGVRDVRSMRLLNHVDVVILTEAVKDRYLLTVRAARLMNQIDRRMPKSRLPGAFAAVSAMIDVTFMRIRNTRMAIRSWAYSNAAAFTMSSEVGMPRLNASLDSTRSSRVPIL